MTIPLFEAARLVNAAEYRPELLLTPEEMEARRAEGDDHDGDTALDREPNAAVRGILWCLGGSFVFWASLIGLAVMLHYALTTSGFVESVQACLR